MSSYWQVQVALYGPGALMGNRRFPADMAAYLRLPAAVRHGKDTK